MKGLIKINISEWKNHKKIDFTDEVGGRESYIVFPDNPLPDKPWVWRTEFFGAFDTVDTALLDKGWFLAYHKASDMYGCPQAIEYFREFQDTVELKFNLSPKPVLFGFSRGGLYAVNYALKYPDRVGCLYLDAPVLDMNTWPGFHGETRESIDCMRWYGGNRDNPIDNVGSLTVPVILVAGDADDLVPMNANAQRMHDICAESGIKIEFVIKKGIGHHPHSLDDPTPVIKFIENA